MMKKGLLSHNTHKIASSQISLGRNGNVLQYSKAVCELPFPFSLAMNRSDLAFEEKKETNVRRCATELNAKRHIWRKSAYKSHSRPRSNQSKSYFFSNVLFCCCCSIEKFTLGFTRTVKFLVRRIEQISILDVMICQ